MQQRINPKWTERVGPTIRDNSSKIDELVSYTPAAQWLIESLTRANRLFKVYNLGAGVKRITTIVDECPCCKRKF